MTRPQLERSLAYHKREVARLRAVLKDAEATVARHEKQLVNYSRLLLAWQRWFKRHRVPAVLIGDRMRQLEHESKSWPAWKQDELKDRLRRKG